MSYWDWEYTHCDECNEQTWHDSEQDCWGPDFTDLYGPAQFECMTVRIGDIHPTDIIVDYYERHGWYSSLSWTPDEYATHHRYKDWNAYVQNTDEDIRRYIVRPKQFVIQEAIHLEAGA